MQVMSHHWCTHKYKTNASYGCTIDVLISIKQMQVMSYHWCTHKYKKMQVMSAPLMYS